MHKNDWNTKKIDKISNGVKKLFIFVMIAAAALFLIADSFATDDMFESCIYPQGQLPATASTRKVKVGDAAPDFTLSSISGERVSLSQYKGKKNVVVSFIPAAWSAVCSEQWPEYIMTDSVFAEYDAVVIGISVDNLPTLFAWTKQMGEVWFPVVSDFWSHGAVADTYGVLRSDGLAERALFVIDKQGIIRSIEVRDINTMPDFAKLVVALQNLQAEQAE